MTARGPPAGRLVRRNPAIRDLLDERLCADRPVALRLDSLLLRHAFERAFSRPPATAARGRRAAEAARPGGIQWSIVKLSSLLPARVMEPSAASVPDAPSESYAWMTMVGAGDTWAKLSPVLV